MTECSWLNKTLGDYNMYFLKAVMKNRFLNGRVLSFWGYAQCIQSGSC